MNRKKRALISVSDKTGVVEFAKALAELGFEIVSTGGTHKILEQHGIPVTGISDVTGFPECLDGRVKTLHPMVHAGILAMRSNEDHMKQIDELGVTPIDVVAINLYPFKQTILKPDVTLEDAIENIDIGGPTMIRAAAKNWQDVAVAVDPADYERIINFDNTLAACEQLHGKELSYNNINDANGALDVLKEFGDEKPCAVAVKHANPCGVGVGETIHDAYLRAYESDPVSIFGGIVALNREVDEETARELAKIFLEIIIAPGFSDKALEILTVKKNIRLLKLAAPAKANKRDALDMKKVAGGLLVQQLDTELFDEDKLTVVTDRAPSEKEMDELRFVWRVVKHVKSNGIALAKDGMTVGVGPGQTNRITALELAVKYAGERAAGSVMGSDAFFPFGDCVECAHKNGITAIIQPGGSVRDQESIDLCNKYGIAMVFTGMRHFKH